MPTPVIFLVFNRPELTARVFARIREARPAKLYVVADGPRPDRVGEAEKCRQVRAVIEQGIDWPCEVVRDYSDVNLGCARRVSSGITNAFKQVEEAIILEDDCLPDPTFFRFCGELLERYRDDERVGQIGGFTLRRVPNKENSSYYFSALPHCWGWATWRRAWRHYDHNVAGMERYFAAEEFHALFPDRAVRRYWLDAFSAVSNGHIDSWAYRWTFALWKNRSLSILPMRNIVMNIGFGIDSTHTKSGESPAAERVDYPLIHPTTIERDSVADDDVCSRVFRHRSLLERALVKCGLKRRLT